MKFAAAAAVLAAVPLVAFAAMEPRVEAPSAPPTQRLDARGPDFGAAPDFIVTADRDAVLKNAAASAAPRG
ncbi:MAG: hypothetical protein KJS97_15705 [Alphaproteobacteria bacterium]|nr:hypothetical protein [Alphaproteobacteria bacterium]